MWPTPEAGFHPGGWGRVYQWRDCCSLCRTLIKDVELFTSFMLSLVMSCACELISDTGTTRALRLVQLENEILTSFQVCELSAHASLRMTVPMNFAHDGTMKEMRCFSTLCNLIEIGSCENRRVARGNHDTRHAVKEECFYSGAVRFSCT